MAAEVRRPEQGEGKKKNTRQTFNLRAITHTFMIEEQIPGEGGWRSTSRNLQRRLRAGVYTPIKVC